MSTTDTIKIDRLALDLANFRTIPQQSEDSAIAAMVSTSPDRFWALMDSLLEDGYLPTESILVLESAGTDPQLTVKEGNRRVAALKVILGLATPDVTIPTHLTRRIAEIDNTWRKANRAVPCVLYAATESDTVDRIVTLAHGKGEKAGRDQWNAVARARHNRDAKNGSEPSLDLLERYLTEGRNHTRLQVARWAGDYPLTVLEEAMKRLAPRLGSKSARSLADAYPGIAHREALEEILKAIGLGHIRFDTIRSAGDDFGLEYGMPSGKSGKPKNGTKGRKGASVSKEKEKSEKRKAKTARIDDPRTLKRLLQQLTPRGSGREKVVQLRDEARKLNLKDTPLAFCFLLRSMFEISAKAYCADHVKAGGPSTKKPGGKDKTLVEVLRDIVKHLTNNKTDQAKLRELHGAMTELANPVGLLSVTSMNQLVHNPNFVVTSTEICVVFGRVFPLLEEMNA